MAEAGAVANQEEARKGGAPAVLSRSEITFQGNPLTGELGNGTGEGDRMASEVLAVIMTPGSQKSGTGSTDGEGAGFFAILDTADAVGDTEEAHSGGLGGADRVDLDVSAGILVVLTKDMVAESGASAHSKREGPGQFPAEMIEAPEEFVGAVVGEITVGGNTASQDLGEPGDGDPPGGHGGSILEELNQAMAAWIFMIEKVLIGKFAKETEVSPDGLVGVIGGSQAGQACQGEMSGAQVQEEIGAANPLEGKSSVMKGTDRQGKRGETLQCSGSGKITPFPGIK